MGDKAVGLVARDSATFAEAQQTFQLLAQEILNGNQDAASSASLHLIEVAIQLYGQVVDWRPIPKKRNPLRLVA